MATTIFNKPIDTEVNDLQSDKMDKPTNTGTVDQILRNDGNGGSVWGNAATQSEIGTAVTNWLNTNVPTGTTVAIDRSLSIDGAAANASTVGDLRSAINTITKDTTLNAIIQFSDPALRQYINTSGTTVQWDTPSVSSGTNIKWAVVQCNAGDKFIISGKGGNSDRLWAFANSSKTVLSRANTNVTASGLELTAPTNAAYLIINDESDSISYTGVKLTTTITELKTSINGNTSKIDDSVDELHDDIGYLTGNEYLEFSDTSLKQYINTSNATVDLTNPSVSSSSVKWCAVECSENDVFVINGTGGNSDRLWAFADTSKNVISRANANVTGTNLIIIAPHNAKYLIVNDESDKRSYKNRKIVDRVSIMENSFTPVDTNWSNYSFSVSTGEVIYASNRCMSEYIPVSKGSKVRIFPNGQYIIAGLFDIEMSSFTAIHNDWTDNNYDGTITSDGFLVVQVRKTTLNPPIDPSEVAATIFIYQNVNGVARMAMSNGQMGITRDVPKNQGVRNAYKKAHQFMDVIWTALSAFPSVQSATGITAGTHEGLPYSSVKEYDKFIGFEVSLKTFMTAVHNPYSLLYTEDVKKERSASEYGMTYNGVNCGSYFGIVCNIFVLYSLGFAIPWNTAEWHYLKDQGIFEKVYDQSGTGVELMDVLWEPGHGNLIIDIYRDNRGTPKKIYVAESVQNYPIIRVYTPESFNTRLQSNGGILYRYKELYKNLNYTPSPFVAVEDETEQTYTYNNDVCTFAGDYASFRTGEEIWINYNLGDTVYTGISVYKGETLVSTYSLSTGHKISIGSSLTAGKYTAVLTGNGTSEPTHFEVIDVNVSASNNSGEITATFSSTNGTPVYAQMTYLDGSSRGIIPIESDGSTITFNANEVLEEQYPNESFEKTTYLKVFFKGDYGVVRNALIDLGLH